MQPLRLFLGVEVKTIALCWLALLAVMSSPAEAETKTVSWYVDHPAARARVKALCLNDPGTAQHVPNCINASAADAEVALRSAPNSRTLLQQCNEMPELFQAANRCGKYSGK